MDGDAEQIERQVLKMLLEGDDPVLAALRIQLGLCERKSREMSGCGFFTYFDVPEKAPRLPDDASIRFGDVTAEIENLEHGAGFVLFVDNGILTMLEAYTYDEPWPMTVASYKLSYMGKPERNLHSLPRYARMAKPRLYNSQTGRIIARFHVAGPPNFTGVSTPTFPEAM